jgi:hypothetical protein
VVELALELGNVLGLLVGEGLPAVAAEGEVADGDAHFFEGALFVGSALFPVVAAASEEAGEPGRRTLVLRRHGRDRFQTLHDTVVT